MATQVEVLDPKAEKKRIADEKKALKKEQDAQRKEAKRRAREIEEAQDRLEEEGITQGGVPVFIVTILIILVWLAILALLIKLDVGGFGSGVLKPIIGDVPIINQILPGTSSMATTSDEEGSMYGGYTSLRDAVEQIKSLELQLEQAQRDQSTNAETISQLQAEVTRLRTFEAQQVEFERIRNQFYEEVIYADNGPGMEAYRQYYEAIDPANAEYLYQQVVTQAAKNEAMNTYASTYSSMKADEAAKIFENMTDNLQLVARILGAMSSDDRGKILGAMDAEVAARLTRIMDPGN